MRVKCDFKKLDFAQILSCFSTKKSKRVGNFEIINFPKEIKLLFQKIKKLPLLQEQLSQPILSIKRFISDLIVQFLRDFKKLLTKRSKVFFKKQFVATYAEKIPKTGFLD